MTSISLGHRIEIMKLVTETTAAAVNEKFNRVVPNIDKLVQTLFSTMCELTER
jgi:hypothetical protein